MKKDQRGFTLVELIVAILIMSMVMLAAAGFVVSAANSYRVSNIEIELQMEAQIAVNQFNDILIEAIWYDTQQKADGTMDKLTVMTAEAVYTFRVDTTKHQLMFSVNGAEEALLAKYCESVQITPGSKPAETNKQIVSVVINFLNSGKTYTTTSCISLRNE
ncbi:MAG: prepilin-type N-terminal cleavage/methylation domain-containing protein [Lachnospiraceae bacterium]|nr:prepilin-type N-terminal cleavage/methylation domain-containing protein [Lachnospiraceae bacterium]